MTLILPRRRFIAGALGLLAAPAIVRASSLMPVRPVDLETIQIVDWSGIATPNMVRVWYLSTLIYQAPIKSIDLQLARAS